MFPDNYNGFFLSPIGAKKYRVPQEGYPIFWCERWDSNPHGVTTRTSNVLVYHSNTLASRHNIITLRGSFVNIFFQQLSVVLCLVLCYTVKNGFVLEVDCLVRFFVAPEEMMENFLVLTGDNAAHAKVLRLKNGEEVLVCDGQGNECICTISDVSPGQISLVVNARQESLSEAKVNVSVYMAFPKADKLEHVIQKATELGVYEIVAFPSARCVSRPDEKSLKKKMERWQKIAASAAEQSGRGRIPQVIVLPSYAEALKRAASADKAILFYENERATTLRMALETGRFQTISLLTGPEGGLETSEVEKAKEAGLQICTLGSRILRCETAPLCALSAVMYATGEF